LRGLLTKSLGIEMQQTLEKLREGLLMLMDAALWVWLFNLIIEIAIDDLNP
jgi:hypothetical protein